MVVARRVHHLRSGGVSLVVDLPQDRGLPRIVHWGNDLGDLGTDDLNRIVTVGIPQVTSYVLDDPVPVAILPEHGLGYSGWPGLTGHRDGADWSPLFTVTEVSQEEDVDGTHTLTVEAIDESAQLALVLELQLTVEGVQRTRATVTNTDASQPYWLDALHLTLPVPPVADELLDLAGRHTRERSPQRQPFHVGTRLRESRRGHGGHDASLLLVAGTAGFGFRTGEVWGTHLAWSGNHRIYAERLPTGGSAVLGAGELLLPGEGRIAPGGSYASPWLYGVYSPEGLDGLSRSLHGYVRRRPSHPATPRPVIVNTWEAVYFDVDEQKLLRLADAAAAVGAERFVMDDGWFRGRRGEWAGLGDWYVDAELWPNGLHTLADHVVGLGLQFGLWVEPESVNPDSDLAREHPEWLFGTGGRTPPASRLQQVLDLSHPGASAYLLERLDALLSEYPISFLKWDLNRDIVDGGHSPRGQASVHANTLALYALLDELRTRHPGVEIESCAGGGGRIDLGILERTDRVWASDTNDPLERQQIQRWTGLLLPPELVGAHVGAAHAHTTHRTHTLEFAGGTALFGHFGIELDLTAMSADELTALGEWVTLYKELRPLIHSGETVHSDHPDPALWMHGIVAPDRSDALFAVVGMQTGMTQPPGMLRLPGLDPDARYAVRLQAPADHPTQTRVPPPWLALAADGELELTGRVLGEVGVQAPFLFPQSLVLLRVERV